MPDLHKNFAYSAVATAPSPAASGTSLVVTAGQGALFPTVPFNAVIWPTGVNPLSTNAEIVRVTAISTDTLTITRTQEGTNARTVVVGDQIAAVITNLTLTDAETAWTAGGTMSGDLRVTGYERVGSSTAPVNTTAGDLTISRLDVGLNTAFPADGRIIQAQTTSTVTAGASYAYLLSLLVAPASNSAATVRGLNANIVTNAASGVTQNTLRSFELQVTHQQDGALTTSIGVMSILVYGTSSAATPGTIGTHVAFQALPFFNNNVGVSAGTITTLYGFQASVVQTAGLTTTTFAGFRCENSTASSFTNYYGLDVAKLDRGSTSSIGARIAFPGVATGLGATTNATGIVIVTASVTMGDQTATTVSAHGISVGTPTYTSTTNVRTITNCAGIYVQGAPVAGTNVIITTGPYSIWVDSGDSRFDGNILGPAVGQTNYQPAEDIVVPDGYSLVVSDDYEIAGTVDVSVASNGRLEVL